MLTYTPYPNPPSPLPPPPLTSPHTPFRLSPYITISGSPHTPHWIPFTSSRSVCIFWRVFAPTTPVIQLFEPTPLRRGFTHFASCWQLSHRSNSISSLIRTIIYFYYFLFFNKKTFLLFFFRYIEWEISYLRRVWRDWSVESFRQGGHGDGTRFVAPTQFRNSSGIRWNKFIPSRAIWRNFDISMYPMGDNDFNQFKCTQSMRAAAIR